MAGRLSLPELDLSCPICCDIFRDPVVLKCSHSFCAPCLQQYWTPGGRGGRSRDCPLCRSQSVDDPVPSLTLRNLCESYLEQESEELPEEAQCEPGELCPLHGERLKLFCLPDQVPICVVCHTSRKHKQHDCCPVGEAAADVKEKMKSALGSLQEKKDAFEQMRKSYEDTVAHIQVQARFVERRTHEEFEKLHVFLRAEEESRMEELWAEEQRKGREMALKVEEIEGSIASVLASIRDLEEEMALDDLSVLHKCKKTLERADAPGDGPLVPLMPPDALIDVAKYVGSLSFHVWEKMREIVKYTPVTLDPNSAAPWLVLSDDLAGVRDSDDRQQLPDNPERFHPDTAVMAREGFATGRHAWDVSVGESEAWVVGVAKASVRRKEKVSSVLSNGYLCVYFYHKMYFAGTTPLTRLSPRGNPRRIRVLLDCDKGRVSFHSPLEGDALIYTFKHAVTEKLFPYFWVGCQKCPLTVEPQEVTLRPVEYF